MIQQNTKTEMQTELGKIFPDVKYFAPMGVDNYNFPIYEIRILESQIRALKNLGFFISSIDFEKAHIWINKIQKWDGDFN